jgi:outer membrane immunogenic protein
LNAGDAWGHSNSVSQFVCPSPGNCAYQVPANLATFSAAGTGSLSGNGFTGGIQAGYNWQWNKVVTGIEVDFNSFNARRSLSSNGLIPSPAGGAGTVGTFTVTTAANADWLFTARGRLGWEVAPSYLIYATGGLAVSEIKVSNFFADNNNPPLPITTGASSSNTTRIGWTIGGGIEGALGRNWTVKAEYLYVDLRSVSTTAVTNIVPFATVPDVLASSADFHANIVRVGINYKFGYTPVAIVTK